MAARYRHFPEHGGGAVFPVALVVDIYKPVLGFRLGFTFADMSRLYSAGLFVPVPFLLYLIAQVEGRYTPTII